MFNEKLKLYYEDNSDKISINDCLVNYVKPIYKDSICLDLGANIGGFAAIALSKGAKKIICVECDERNFNLLSHNFKNIDLVETIRAAVSNKNGIVKVLKNNSKRRHISAKTSELHTNSRYKVICDAIALNIDELIEKHQPNILKVDIEGSEFICFEDTNKKINKCVQYMFLEIHFSKKNTLDKLQHILDQFEILEKIDSIYFNTLNGCNLFLRRKSESI